MPAVVEAEGDERVTLVMQFKIPLPAIAGVQSLEEDITAHDGHPRRTTQGRGKGPVAIGIEDGPPNRHTAEAGEPELNRPGPAPGLSRTASQRLSAADTTDAGAADFRVRTPGMLVLGAAQMIGAGCPVQESTQDNPDPGRRQCAPSPVERAGNGADEPRRCRSHGRCTHAAQSAAVHTRDRLGDVGPMPDSRRQALFELDAVGPSDGQAVDDVAGIVAAEDVVGTRDANANI
jgi:hypothetical protein